MNQESNVRILRGLNYAILAISIFMVLLGGVFTITMIFASTQMSNSEFFDQFVQELQSSSSSSPAFDGDNGVNSYDFSGLSADQIASLASAGFGVIIALGVGYMVLNALGIVAAFLTLKRSVQPERLGAAFVWSIVAAAGALFAGSFITLVLLVISIWMNSRVRKVHQFMMQGGWQGFYANNPGPGQWPQQPGNPYQPGNPGQPYQTGNPNQPYQPGNPNMPGQPGQTGQAQPSQPQPGQPQPGQPQPAQGALPAQSQQPEQSAQPAQPSQPEQPAQPAQPQQPGQPSDSDQPTDKPEK